MTRRFITGFETRGPFRITDGNPFTQPGPDGYTNTANATTWTSVAGRVSGNAITATALSGDDFLVLPRFSTAASTDAILVSVWALDNNPNLQLINSTTGVVLVNLSIVYTVSGYQWYITFNDSTSGAFGDFIGTGGAGWAQYELLVAPNSGGSAVVTLYRNKIQVNQQTLTGGTFGTTYHLRIAAQGNGLGGKYNLTLDDLIVDTDSVSPALIPAANTVRWLAPISDAQRGSWTGGAGGTTSLFDAINNYPVIGTDVETNLTQIESIDASGNNATDEYRVNLTTYATGAPVGYPTVRSIQPWISHGEDIATGIKTGSIAIQSNPVQAAQTFTFGEGSAAVLPYPNNWRWTGMAPVESPTVTRASSPVLALRKTDTGTRVASVAAMGMYVEYAPASPPMARRSRAFPYPALNL